MHSLAFSSRSGWTKALIEEIHLQQRVFCSFVRYVRLAGRTRWSREMLATFQQTMLEEALRKAARFVPFHRKRQPADVENICRWPLTTRRELQNADVADLLDQRVASNDCSVYKTSGSTGEPVCVYYTAADLRLRWLYFVRMFRTYGLPFLCRIVEIGQYKHSRTYVPGQRWTADQRSFVSVREPVDARLDLIAQIAPHAIIGYTSDLAEMATRCFMRGIVFPSLRVVIGVGELMDVAKREAIRSGWGISPYDSYGAVEAGNIAFECPSRSGTYHLHADHLFVEVLRPDGSVASEGEIGEVAVTSLAYHAMPLIRYQLGDLAAVGPPCSCGSPLPTLQRLYGRSDDVITLTSGRRLTPLAVNRAFCGSGLRRYRLRQSAPGHFNLELDGDANAALGASRAFREILDPEDELEVTRVTLPSGQIKERVVLVEAS